MSFHLDANGILRLAAWQDLPWLVHGFTTRQAGDFGNGVPAVESLGRIGAAGLSLRTVRQIHSNCVCRAGDEVWPEGSQRPEADALVTDLAGHVLGVRTADCLPLLLVDRGKRAVAAVHAGWRGTQQRIAACAVEEMRHVFGSEPQSLEAAIGPGIAACCFEVGPEVAEQFDPSLVVSADSRASAPGSPLETAPKAPRPRVDLVEANRRQLLEQGIRARNIWSAVRCTCCNPKEFFSYRRDSDTARMLAFIGVLPG